MPGEIPRNGIRAKLRAALVTLGSALVLIALLADQLGLGTPGSLGIGQVILALTGILVALGGILGRTFPRFYRGLAVVLLNTVVLLAVVEITAIVMARVAPKTEDLRIKTLPYYASKDWSDTYWREAHGAFDYRYDPYVVWKNRPISGELVNLDDRGFRHTPGTHCIEGAFRIFAFGGSTMQGWGAPDWGTITAHLQEGLERRLNRAVCLVNLAVDGYVSTQSVVAMLLELQSGNVPDAVIFYDGVNDVLAAYESGQPRTHVTLQKIASRFERREHPLGQWLRSSRIYALLNRWVIQPFARPNAHRLPAHEGLADAVARNYLANQSVVKALSAYFGFDYYFFWQPHLGIGNKVLTVDEAKILQKMNDAWLLLARETYSHIASVDSDGDRMWNLSNAFDDSAEQLWIDHAGHITPEGNRLVALWMLNVIGQPRHAEVADAIPTQMD